MDKLGSQIKDLESQVEEKDQEIKTLNSKNLKMKSDLEDKHKSESLSAT